MDPEKLEELKRKKAEIEELIRTNPEMSTDQLQLLIGDLQGEIKSIESQMMNSMGNLKILNPQSVDNPLMPSQELAQSSALTGNNPPLSIDQIEEPSWSKLERDLLNTSNYVDGLEKSLKKPEQKLELGGRELLQRPEYKPRLKNGPEDPTVSALGMLPGVGSVVQLGQALIKGPEVERYNRIAPELVDYNPLIASRNSQINTSMDSVDSGIRSSARTFGQSAVARGTVEQRRQRALGENTAALKSQEFNTNAQLKNQANFQNQQISMQETQNNAANRAAWRSGIARNIIDIGTTIAGFGADKVALSAQMIGNRERNEAIKTAAPSYRIREGSGGTFDGVEVNPLLPSKTNWDFFKFRKQKNNG